PPSRDTLVALLERHAGVVARVAAELGRSTRQVYRWLERHGVDPDDHR
ncbi:MAG: helix-turn-helix domain-containing protein, partial [Myxococcales bacterium]|nr:helix-turn-helix domain-containing protein [Myxococcales bacterium]